MVNKVILIGNLGRDPEVRSTQGGQSVASLSVATTRRVKKGEEWTDETDWHTVVAWGRLADNVGKYCKKGKQIYVEGRLQTRKWQDKQGQDRWSTEVVAEDVRFLGGGGERREEPRSGGGGSHDTPAQGGDDEIPFVRLAHPWEL